MSNVGGLLVSLSIGTEFIVWENCELKIYWYLNMTGYLQASRVLILLGYLVLRYLTAMWATYFSSQIQRLSVHGGIADITE